MLVKYIIYHLIFLVRDRTDRFFLCDIGYSAPYISDYAEQMFNVNLQIER